MNNLFWYTRKEYSEPKEGTEIKMTEFQDCFSLLKVIRGIQLEDGRMLVLLDDLHTRVQEVPMRNNSGKITGTKREPQVFQSEIYLEKEDVKRFLNATSEQ